MSDKREELVRCLWCHGPAIHTTSEEENIDNYRFALTNDELERVIGMLLLYDATTWAKTIIEKLRVARS